ncbi:MAG: hypothetical protein ACYCUD_05105 [Candidatus Dormibacteria bacterium]
MLHREPASVLSQTAPSQVFVALVTEPVAKTVEWDMALTPPVDVPPGRWTVVQLAPPSLLTTRGCGTDPVYEGAVLANARVEDTQSTAAVPQPPYEFGTLGWTTLQLPPPASPKSSTGDPDSLPGLVVGYCIPVATTCEPVTPIHPRYTPGSRQTVCHERPESAVTEIMAVPAITTPLEAEVGYPVFDATKPR